MKRPAVFRKAELALIALAVAALLLAAGPGWAKSLTVSRPNQPLYLEPNFASPPLGPVPAGERVNLICQQGDWCKVDYQGKIGWLRCQALLELAPAETCPTGLLFGGPVRETRSDEAALAGKGITPEVGMPHCRKNPR